MPLTLKFSTARDLLAKVERDLQRLEECVSSDDLLNFAIASYSVIDWIKNDPSVPGSAKADVRALYNDRDMKLCGELANSGKHHALTKRAPIAQDTASDRGGAAAAGEREPGKTARSRSQLR